MSFWNSIMQNVKKYLQVATHVEGMIRQGHFKEGDRLPSDKALAKSLNVTTVTVNKGLNLLVKRNLICRKVGSGTFVAPKSGVRRKSLRIGIFIHVTPKNNDWYISTVMGCFHDFWKEQGGEVILLIKTGPEYRKAIEDYGLDAAMTLCPEPEIVPFIADLKADGFPMVTVGSHMPGLEDCAFGVDHKATVEKAVAYLAGLGHSEIGMMTSANYKTVSVDQRIEGYVAGMWNCKLPLNPDWTIEVGATSEIEKILLERKRRGSLPTALLMPYSALLMPTCSALQAAGIRVPEDISLLGFDDLPETAHISPPLTVFAYPLEEIAKGAAEFLSVLLGNARTDGIPRHYGCELIIRSSCKAPAV